MDRETLEEMRREIPVDLRVDFEVLKSCRACELRERKVFVYGAGRFDVPLFVLGLAPGAEEDESGVPFVGRSGMLLRDTMTALGFDPRSGFITNLVACRPPKNRNPQPSEVEQCRPRFDSAIVKLNPKVILAVGTIALASLTGIVGIEKNRGRLLSGCVFAGDMVRGSLVEFPTIGTYHPAGLLRGASSKQMDEFRSDISKAIEIATA